MKIRNFATFLNLIVIPLGFFACSSSTNVGGSTSNVNRYPVVNSCAPISAAAGFNTPINSVQYSTASTNNFLSVYTPLTGSSWPMVAWIHGGGWDNSALFYNTAFTKNEIITYLIGQGYAVASIDYRYSTALNNPGVAPAQIQDVRCAIMWLKAHATANAYDTTNIVAVGESAGGHLAAMLAMNIPNGGGFDDAAHCGSYPGDASVHSAVLFYPATDLRSSANFTTASISGLACATAQVCLDDLLGGTPEANPTLAASVSPITYLSSTTIPLMVVAGAADSLIVIGPTRNFVSTLKAYNRPITYVELAGVDHGFLATDTVNFWAGANSATVPGTSYAAAMCTAVNFIKQTSSGQ